MLSVVNDLLQASNSGHVSILSLLDLSAAFDTIDHDILIKRLHTTFGCSGTVLDWFTSYLSFRTQSVFVGHASTPSALKCGVPQGSVLGPLLFTLYTQCLCTVTCQSGHSYHFFADDSQLLNSIVPSDFPALVHSLKDCIEDVAARIVLRKLRHVSATSLFRTLHWLPVKARIQYKIACLYFQCLSHNTMPPYLSDLLHPYQPSRTLCSLDTSLLSVPRFCLETFGRRYFSVFGPTVWNSLPLSLRKKLNVFQLSKRS